MRQSVALQIREDVLKNKEAVYRMTISCVDEIDEVRKDPGEWIGWKERLLSADQRLFTLPWKKKGFCGGRHLGG